MFTIVIPVYNRVSLIIRLLDSIVAQTLRHFCVIIVDNGSTDGTYQAVKDWIDRHCHEGIDFSLLEEKTPGAAAARNCGLNAVITEYMCFFDSDDTLRPDFVETIVKNIHSNDHPDLVLYNSLVHYEDGKTRELRPSKINILSNHILHCALATEAFVARTEVFRCAGGWNPDILFWDDWELGIRILRLPDLNITDATEKTIADKYEHELSITGNNFISKSQHIEKVLRLASVIVADSMYYSSLVSIVRARIAGRIRREGGKSEAKALLSRLKKENWLDRTILRGVYYHTILFRRGSAIWAEPLFRWRKKK